MSRRPGRDDPVSRGAAPAQHGLDRQQALLDLVAGHTDPAALEPKPLPDVHAPSRERAPAGPTTVAPSLRLLPERRTVPSVQPPRPRRPAGSGRAPIPGGRWGGRWGGRRRLAAIGAIALVGGGGLALVATRGDQTATTGAQPLDVAGHIEAAQTTPLDFRVAGQVVKVNVKAGQAVTAGTVLASLDTAQLSAQLRAAKDAVTTAQQKLSLDASGSPGALAQAAALAGVDAAQQQANAAATNYNDTRALTLAALQGSQLAGQAAARQILATAQAQLAAAQTNLLDTSRVSATQVGVANQALNGVETNGEVQVQAAQVQLQATQRNANDTQNLDQKNVNVAQATLKGDQNILNTDIATTCGGSTAAACAPTIAKDQATVRLDRANVAQAQATAKLDTDQAIAQEHLAQVALDAADAALQTARDAAKADVNQEIAKGLQSNNQAAAVVRLAQIALQDAIDTTTGPAAQNSGVQNLLKAQSAIDQAQIGLDGALVAANSARRQLAALHAPPAVQIVLTDQSGVDAAQAQVDLSQHDLDGATLIAPVSGVVERINIAPGEQVAGGAAAAAVTAATAGSAAVAAPAALPATASLTHAIVLETPDAFQLSGAVRETDVIKLKVGDPVSVVTAAYPQAFDGTITDIAPAGTLRGNLVTFAISATFEAPGTHLAPGMTARMRVLGVTTGGTSTTTSSTTETSSESTTSTDSNSTQTDSSSAGT